MLRRGLIVIALLLAGCTKSDTSRTLHLYTALDSDEAPHYIKEVEKKLGIEVKWVRLSAGEVLARLEAERNNPQASVWFGGSAPEFIAASRKGLLESYHPQIDFDLPAGERDPDWKWVGFYFGAIGFACNKKFFEEKHLKMPQSWDDLLDPSLQGRVSVAFPYTSGTGYTIVAALLQMYGAEKGWEYIRKLDRQVHHYNKSGTAAVTQVGLGEVAVGIAFSHDILRKGRDAGYPVELTIPKEGTASEIGGLAMIKGAKEPELAKRFIDEILSTDAQNVLQKFNRVPLNPKATVAVGAVTPSQVKLISFNAEKAAEDQKEILDRWRKVTAR